MERRHDAEYWIERFGLRDHREGGHFTETYACEAVVDGETDPGPVEGERPTATSIYYLLKGSEFSTFHRMDADELWHFYRGDPIRLYLLDDGLETVLLGRDRFQTVVPQDTWFAAETVPDAVGGLADGYALVGCDVTPGFDYDGYELADESLAESYEDHRDLIERLT
jgi:predicted cupin superfamily sugar epimerase